MLSDVGIILRKHALSETSLITVWITAHHGVQRIVAKSALKPKNQFHGFLDLFYSNELQWKKSNNASNLHNLVATSIIDHHQSIRLDYHKLSLASYFGQLVVQTLESDHPADDFYDLILRAFNYLDDNPATMKALLHFERETARLHGIYNKNEPAHTRLKEHFGTLPKQRSKLVALLEK